MAGNLTNHWRRLMAGSLFVLAAAFALPRLVPPPALDENRTLAPPPIAPTDLKSLRAFPKDADRYVADHFPPRAQLIGALNFLRLKLGVSGSTRVIVGRDGWLFYDTGTHMGSVRGDPKVSDADARVWLSGLAGRTEALRTQGVAYLAVAAPDKEAIYPQRGPAWFRPDPHRTTLKLARLAAQAQAGEIVYPAAALMTAARAGTHVYAPYETHWTGLGAYEGYAAIVRRLQAMGVAATGPRPLSDFSYVKHSEAGTPRNLALMLGIASFVPIDFPEVTDQAIEPKLTTTWLSDGFDWTKPRVIDTGVPGKPVLLMTMDSFSNALLPFLYGDFSRIVLAHDQDGFWRQDLIDRFKPDVVITEVVESGFQFAMQTGPTASPVALARIDQALAHPSKAAVAQPPPPILRTGPRPARVLAPVAGRVAKVLEGGPADDRLDGTAEDDVISGRGGADTLHGGGGNDILRGGKGNDVIDGGEGDDQLWGDLGDDTLTGGPGADRFYGREGGGRDVITDFRPGEGDRIVLDPGTAWRLRQDGPDAVVELRGSQMVLKGVKAAALPPGWLVFAAKP